MPRIVLVGLAVALAACGRTAEGTVTSSSSGSTGFGSTSSPTTATTGTSTATLASASAGTSSSAAVTSAASSGSTTGPSSAASTSTSATSASSSTSGASTSAASTGGVTTSGSTGTSSSAASTTTTTATSSSSGAATTSTSTSTSGSSSSGGTLCTPGALRCTPSEGNLTQARQLCSIDGSTWADTTACTGADYCGTDRATPGSCVPACQASTSNLSDLGCDYWGAVLSNSMLAANFTGGSVDGSPGTLPSQFAFVVVNPLPQLAHVTVSQTGLADVTAAVSAGSTSTLYLPWRTICGTGQAGYGYHLTSDSPVTAYQFNPLASSLPDDCALTCTDGGVDCGSGPCACSDPSTCPGINDACINGVCTVYSYTNDASLLVPTPFLGTSYVAVAASQTSEGQTGTSADQPLAGMIAVLAVADLTFVQVQFAGDTFSTTSSIAATGGACTAASGNLSAEAAGSTAVYTLNAGDLLQFWSSNSGMPVCASVNSGEACLYPNDLTGTVITTLANGGTPALPIAVFGGADCADVPWNQAACDHLEEEMTPYATWGEHFVAPKSVPYADAGAPYPDVYRVVSACGATSCPTGATVTITPPLLAARGVGGASCTTSGNSTTCSLPTLGGSSAPWVEFSHSTDFALESDQPVMLAKYFVGQDAAGLVNGLASATEGDPALVMLSPAEQWRTSYSVLAPNTYRDNFLALAAASLDDTTGVTVDGIGVSSTAWANVAGTSSYVATVHVCGSGDASCQGNHLVQSTSPIGVTVYGYDLYVAYSYPGGQNLTLLNSAGVGQ